MSVTKSSGGEDAALQRCREIYESREQETGSYPGDQKDYDKGWINRLNKIMQYIEGGERDIYQILAKLRNFWMSGRWQIGELADFRTGDQTTQLLARSAYVYYRHAVADAVCGEARKDTGAVIDLGSGNGEQVFWVWGEARIRGARFYGCEFSEAGRRTARLLASLDPRMKFTPRFFDYRVPNLHGLKRDKGHAVVYSTHSIEQVNEIPATLLEQLCDLAPSVTGLHFEPIGWQFAPDQDDPHVKAHRERCLEFNYNENFWALLKDFESRGLINIKVAEPYFAGFAYNATCKIVWEKR